MSAGESGRAQALGLCCPWATLSLRVAGRCWSGGWGCSLLGLENTAWELLAGDVRRGSVVYNNHER